MKMTAKIRLLFGVSLLSLSLVSGSPLRAANPTYVITNDDGATTFGSTATLFSIGTNSLLTQEQTLSLGPGGIGGGYFVANRVVVFNRNGQECAFVSQAATGQIEGINLKTQTVAAKSQGSKKDTGSSNGVGLGMSSKYLYASFSDSSHIGTFQLHAGCNLSFVGDVAVRGLQGGVVDGMAVHGNLLVVTYGDGSIESFNVSAGKPVSNGDKQNSTGSHDGAVYPAGVDITKDGHFAIFGDTATSTVVEVSDISAGNLTPTIAYRLGNAMNSSNIMLSPDETLLFITNNQSGRISAAFFNKSTGTLAKGCVSGALRGFVANWSYLASLTLQETTGTGGVIYVAEYGSPSSIAEVGVKSVGGKCSLAELPKSPAVDANSQGLLSIGAFPPRPF